MTNKPNYKQLFDKQKEIEKILQVACPNIRHESGLYFLTREEEGNRYAYIGKGVDVCRRMVSHVQGYQQRIDISLRKRGFYSNSNQLGWRLKVLYFPKHLLDEQERYYIEQYRKMGVIMYNVESGGTLNKEIIGEKKPAKTYKDGLAQGDKRTKRKIKEFFDKYLDFSAKQPINVIRNRKYNEFKEWLESDE